ncbi:hypothetical protein P153DRAFT_383277 [Dothidotthia symphoricarpi CBS 119687]|uniref:Heterokaryon incompatibility domain-containing protein n=1 Tax=Dothidotthia symphoricarpi CBS 119687 TaxID=1392245 RepID=A0A6A6AN78_9PLEO|nr:uncharacterized protein P153DRAFT_383277 [Dothidotthia symphoricarpi CBS 119687]KAF2132394.1 hypothetical protein P153DRAFT_383277 [Dothidotthia symphoricarpi CBS 119687]
MSTPIRLNQPKNHSIRLLQLLPGDPESQLECHLIDVFLKTSPPYEVLSYTSDSPATDSILIDDQPTPISLNLALALRSLRVDITKPTIKRQKDPEAHVKWAQPVATVVKKKTPLTKRYGPRMLWVDTLCLDPTSETPAPELTKAVHAKATSVIAWLGAGDVSAAIAAMDFVHFRFLPDVKELEQAMQDQGREDVWAALRRVFESPWWAQGGFMKELAKGKAVVMRFGEREVDRKKILKFATWYGKQDEGGEGCGEEGFGEIVKSYREHQEAG